MMQLHLFPDAPFETLLQRLELFDICLGTGVNK